MNFAPLPDLVLYWTIFGELIRSKNYKPPKCARGQCATCQGMFTLVKEIKYRGLSIESNLICDNCYSGSGTG